MRRFLPAACVILAALTCGLPVSAPPQMRLTFLTATPTPFQPVGPTFTPARITQTADAPAAPLPAPALADWWSMDFSADAAPIRVSIEAEEAIHLAFRPGWPCEYADHRACTGLYEARGAPMLLASVHSGLGGEAEPLRYALEGLGLNRAALPLDEIQRRLDSLRGAPVSLEQEGVRRGGLRVLAAARVPPGLLDAYFRQPFSTAVDLPAALDPQLESALGHPLLFIETCGWRHPAEAWAPGVVDTTGAIYLLAVGEE